MIYAALAIIYYAVINRSVLGLLRQPLVQALFGAASCILMVLWQLKGQLPQLPPIHFLGLTTLVIVLGLRLSVLVVPIALGLPVLIFALPWMPQPAAINEPHHNQWLWQCLVMLIVTVQTYGLLLLTQKWLPRQLFVVIFVGGFFNSIVCSISYLLLMALVYSQLGLSNHNISEYLTITPLLAFPEGLLNGMVLTILLVYRPQWLKYSLWQDTPMP